MITRQRHQIGELGIAPAVMQLVVAAVPAIISAVSSMSHSDAPPPPPCTFWQNFKKLFGGHPPCSG
jgi:hypothetical protein